jgi:hypothetical protein
LKPINGFDRRRIHSVPSGKTKAFKAHGGSAYFQAAAHRFEDLLEKSNCDPDKLLKLCYNGSIKVKLWELLI